MIEAARRRSPTTREEARSALIFALDVPSVREAEALVDELSGVVTFYKVGLELWCAGGQPLVEKLVKGGLDVFVDLKLHDIPNTVASAAAVLADLGARFTTVHGPPSAVRAAAKAVDGRVALLGVTVLTSMDEAEWRESLAPSDTRPLSEVVRDRARSLLVSGCAGLVASPLEAATLRAAHPDAILVTPGVRPAGGDVGDQKRVATPRAAAEAGVDHVVVGRPIKDAPDRRAAAEAIVDDLWAGYRGR